MYCVCYLHSIPQQKQSIPLHAAYVFLRASHTCTACLPQCTLWVSWQSVRLCHSLAQSPLRAGLCLSLRVQTPHEVSLDSLWTSWPPLLPQWWPLTLFWPHWSSCLQMCQAWSPQCPGSCCPLLGTHVSPLHIDLISPFRLLKHLALLHCSAWFSSFHLVLLILCMLTFPAL